MKTDNIRAERARMMLLARFLRPTQLSELSHSWNEVLGSRVSDTIDRFIKEGIIVPSSLSTKIEVKLTVTELKRILKTKGLNLSGKKANLISRLIDHDGAALREKAQTWKIYECSENGRTLASQFETSMEAEKTETEKQVVSLLTDGKFQEAVMTVASFESKQVFPRRYDLNWENYSPISDTEKLYLIFSTWPKLLSNVPEELVHPLRIGAAMLELFGEHDSENRCIDSSVQGTHLEATTAMRMIGYHASHVHSITQFKKMGATRVRILGGDDEESCPQCAAMNGKSFPIDTSPELPHATCTSECGCRCTAILDGSGGNEGGFLSNALAACMADL
jgi:hypothetical protein